jgi:hypothetical protein
MNTAILISDRYGSTRWLKNGWQIGCYPVNFKGVEINTPEDVLEWEKINT